MSGTIAKQTAYTLLALPPLVIAKGTAYTAFFAVAAQVGKQTAYVAMFPPDANRRRAMFVS